MFPWCKLSPLPVSLCLLLLTLGPGFSELDLMEDGAAHPRGDSATRSCLGLQGHTGSCSRDAGKTPALRHKGRKHNVLLVLETFISRVNNNNKVVYGCEFHCLPRWGSNLLPPLFRACKAPSREAGLAAGRGRHCLPAAGRAGASRKL